MEFNSLMELVQNMLSADVESRSDDFKLWLKVSNEIYENEGLNQYPGDTDFYLQDIYKVMMNAKKWGLPAFESVSRARRKIQEQHPELCDQETKKARTEKAEQTKAYFKKQKELAKRYAAGDRGVTYSPITFHYLEIGDYEYCNEEI